MEFDNKRGQAMVLTNMGKALAAERRNEEAAEEYRKGFKIDLELKNQRGLKIVTPALIKTLQQLNRQEEALECCRQALAVAPNDRTLLGIRKRLSAAPAERPRALVKQGVLKRILTHQKGYRFAFVAPDDKSPDIYVREGRVGSINFSNLCEGLAVEVEIEQGPQGPRALRVQVLPGIDRNTPTSKPSS
jgi:CspA family cold shock protein